VGPDNENPDSLAGEIGAEGIEALPTRVDRYRKAKQRALDVSEYIWTLLGSKAWSNTHEEFLLRLGRRVARCGDYLVFRHYYTVNLVRLHAAQLCSKHLLCPLCAIRRGAKALKAYLERWEAIKEQTTGLKPFLVTLTVKDGEDLLERFNHLHSSQAQLWKRRARGRGSVLDCVQGAVWSYEVKRGSGSGTWHPHLHMVALCEDSPDQTRLVEEWHDITGDSFVVDVRPIEQLDPVSGFIEVFKYAVKFSDQTPADTFHCFSVLGGRRLIGSAGLFRGVEIPESLLDEPLDDLPYVTLFFRYFIGKGYGLDMRMVSEERQAAA
jgi:hypothetical protein